MAKSEQFKVAFGRNGPKRAFSAKYGQILKGPKSRKQEFSPKIRNVTSLSFMDSQLHARNQKKKYSAVLAAEPERTDAQE